MTLQFRAQLTARNLDVSLHVDDAERIAILGPNGAGKSTVLAMIAGLLRPDAGRAELDGDILFELGSSAGNVWTTPHTRGVALMAQEPLLFPHMSALENVAFGPRSAGARADNARSTARHWLEEVDATALAGRKPAQLSGGQAQRVAIARALAAQPRLLLLDEPMAALDVGAAPMLRQVLHRVLADRAAIIVTHNVLDALVLAQRVIVVDHGHVVESGPTRDVLRSPRTPFTARIAGLNMITGEASGTGVEHQSGLFIEGLGATGITPGTTAIAVFSPSAVSVFRQPPHGSPRNVLPVTITELEPRDEQVRIRADDLTADVTAPVVAELDLTPGTRVFFSIKASAVTIYSI
ncbi:MAG: ATP-binding cassette domain-containing protein [Nocardioidaceae bacterium]|nr:ATP-binding cassette domain-containing protein [Nocardioidaceae bacterium]